MEPKYQPGDRVNHAAVACKKNGLVEAVIECAAYNLYRVRWCACRGDYYEDELVPGREPEERMHDGSNI